MKLITLISIFILSNIQNCHSKIIPKNILLEMKNKNLTEQGLIYIVRSDECASCNYAELKILSNYSDKFDEKVYFLFGNIIEQKKYETIINRGKYDLKKIIFINSISLFDFFKSHKIVKYIKTKYSVKNLDYINLESNKLVLKKSTNFQLPNRNISFYHHLFLLNEQLYTFNSQLGEVRFLNSFGTTDSISLYNLVDKGLIFRKLNLNAIDSILTKKDIYNSEIIGNRFIDFLNYCPSADAIYFTVSINYTHEYTEYETEKILSLENQISKEIKKENGKIHSTKNQLFVIKFDAKWKLISLYNVGTASPEYSPDFYSPFLITENSVLGNIKYYPKKKENFNQNNFAYVEYKIKGDTLQFFEFSNFFKPSWFYKNKIYNNYSNAFFHQGNDDQNYYVILSYPCVIDPVQKIKYEMPYDKLGELAKWEGNKKFRKPVNSFITLGIINKSNNEKVLIIRSLVTKNIYALSFNSVGDYLSFQELKSGLKYDGFFCVLNGKIARIKGESGEYFEIE